MKGNHSFGIDVAALVQITQNTAVTGFIDDPENLHNDRVWIFSALNDTVVACVVQPVWLRGCRHLTP